jgi:rhamnulokinase
MPKPGDSYLAFDFGAESGRAVLGRLQSGILNIEEVHRFPNQPVIENGSLHWDVGKLWSEVRKSLALLHNEKITSIGVDAWGVDYALLGAKGELLHNPYQYRDRRTEGVMEEVHGKISKEEIYRTTGIQFMPINTLYQFFAECRDHADSVARAKYLITIPDLFNYWLTGKIRCEYTNATTTQMVDPHSRNWAFEMLGQLQLPSTLLAPIIAPGSVLGQLLPHLAENSACAGANVIAPACHDTGSAVAAIKAREDTAFLSSGTWSLIGTEIDAPLITSDTLRLNFTNEGGVDGTTRLLKNVMGLWMLQGCRQSWTAQQNSYDYPELMNMAEQQQPFEHLVDPDDESFLRATDMPAALAEFCRKTQQPIPSGPATCVRTVLDSLALKYRVVLRSLEQVTGRHIAQIRVIGGGSKNRLLNQLTADATGKTVVAGPAEATALGNIAMQILATGGAASLDEVRSLVDRSFPTEVFEPINTDAWDQHAPRFEHYCESIYA